jgi:hypothetical protein
MASRKAFSSKTDTPQVNPLGGVTFTLDDAEFRCEGRMSFLDMSDLARRVSDLPTTDLDELQKVNPVQAAALISSMSSTLLLALGDGEYLRFREHCRAHATPDDVIVEVLQWINQAVQGAVEEGAGRPTGPPSPSSSGEPATEPRMSRIISLQHGDVTVIPEGQQAATGTGEPAAGERNPAAGKQPAVSQVKTVGAKSGGRRRTA